MSGISKLFEEFWLVMCKIFFLYSMVGLIGVVLVCGFVLGVIVVWCNLMFVGLLLVLC